MSACLDCGGSECICRFKSRIAALEAENARLKEKLAVYEDADPGSCIHCQRRHDLERQVAGMREALEYVRPVVDVVPGSGKYVARIDAALATTPPKESR